ncbi:unnamed protein product, partial [Allacma fusca]
MFAPEVAPDGRGGLNPPTFTVPPDGVPVELLVAPPLTVSEFMT